MSIKVSVITAKGSSAIAVIAFWGSGADDTATKYFGKGHKAAIEIGSSYVCQLSDGDEVLDEVVVGKLGEGHYHICSHGNPLIVKSIVSLLCKVGAIAVGSEAYFTDFYEGQVRDRIGLEAALAKSRSVSMEGVKYVDKMEGVLRGRVKEWSEEHDILKVKEQIKEMLDESRGGMSLVYGAKVILAGEPNSGKSTLLNTICRKKRALVTDMAGTTRDYVNAVVWTGKTEAEIIDTAGLDDEVAKAGLVDRVAQDKTLEVLSDCDVVLNVIDASKDGEIRRFDGAGCVVNVLNKSDLGVCEKYSGLSNSVVISARLNEGIDELMDAVHRQLGLLDKSSEKGCCFSMVLESEFYKALVADDILIVRKVMEGLVSSQDEFFYAEDL